MRVQAVGEVVAVRMFGSLELRAGGARLGVRDLGGIKPRQLLEVLLLERGRMVPKDRIADLLWGERLPKKVATTIENYVSVLRRELDKALGFTLIVTEPGGYRLLRERLDTDVDRFDALLGKAASAAATIERRRALEAAVQLVDAELLADEPYAAWVLPQREHERARLLQALIDLAECCLEHGDPRAALDASRRGLDVEPSSERSYRAKMQAHLALGNRDDALRSYERCRTALSEHLGVSPTAQTAELHAAILRDDLQPAARLVRLGAGLPIGYADSRGARVAYQVVGEAPIDLVFSPSSVTNLGATWDDPMYAAFLRRLASMGRLILFDKRGTGLSDPAIDFPTVRERSEDLLAVLDAAGSRRAVLFGVCAGGALCAQFAADHRDRAAGLILHNSMARMLCDVDYPWGWTEENYQLFLAAFEQAWLGDGDGQVRRNPSLAENPRYRDWFARYVRLSANPWMARRLAELNAQLDVRDVLGAIDTPCLVICRTEDAWLDPANSAYLVEHIPGARLLELPGVDHDPWVGDTEDVLEATATFIEEVSQRSEPDDGAVTATEGA